MNVHRFQLLVSFLFVAAACGAAARPNVLLIVSDDQGYADAGFQGSTEIPTPNLDRLAQSGLRCTSGYVSHPYCSPTRAGLMTGRYQQRFGHENNPVYNPQSHTEGLPISEKLLPQYLREAGYTTGWIGKWHLGAAPELRPRQRGFMETFGFIGGGHHYQNWNNDVKVEYKVPVERNGQPVVPPQHLTRAWGHEGADFVRRHAEGDPWFLYLAFNAPHTPHEAPPERLAKFASIADPRHRGYVAQITLLDDAVGEVLDALQASGQSTNTLVFFFSDNGGPNNSGVKNTPLRGFKGDTYEGGVRVPFLVSWPGTLPAGKTYDQPVISLDVLATSLALAGAPLPTDKKFDSVNLLPFLKGEQPGAPHEFLYWRSHAKLAVRQDRWKLVRVGQQPDELYDLGVDPGEAHDLASAEPDVARRLATALDRWNSELIAPVFPARVKGAGK